MNKSSKVINSVENIETIMKKIKTKEVKKIKNKDKIKIKDKVKKTKSKKKTRTLWVRRKKLN